VLKDDGLAIAGTGPSTKQEQVYDIVFTNDDSMAAEKAQRDKEARAKRYVFHSQGCYSLLNHIQATERATGMAYRKHNHRTNDRFWIG